MRIFQPRYLLFFCKTAVAMGLISWLLFSGRLNIGILLDSPFSVDRCLVLSGMLLLYMAGQGLRWWTILLAQKLDISLWRGLQLSWISQFFAQILPGSTGGDMTRAIFIARDCPEGKGKAVSTVFLDRYLGIYSFLWLGILAIPLYRMTHRETSPPLVHLMIWLCFLLLAASLPMLFFAIPYLRNRLTRFFRIFFRINSGEWLENYLENFTLILKGFAISILSNILFVGGFLYIGQSLDINLSWPQVALLVPFLVIANTIPISPGGLGVGETASSYLFLLFNTPKGAEIMLIFRLWTMILRLPGGILFLFHKTTRKKTFQVPLEQGKKEL